MSTFSDVMLNPYVAATIELFRVQMLAAQAVGDTEEAEAFMAAIDALLEVARTSGPPS